MHWITNGVFLAIIAHGLIGISLIWDKILLQRPATKSLANYVFWLGAISIFGLLLIPFGFKLPNARMALLAVGTGVVHLSAIWFYYAALKRGEASETLSLTGGFTPLLTALLGIPLLDKPIGDASMVAFALMVAGGFVMFASEKMNWKAVIVPVVLSAALFALTNVLQKVVFNATGFVSGYVLFTLGTFLGAMALLLRPVWRRQIFEDSEEAPPKSKLWYFVNRFLSGVGSFLIFLAISKTNPAIVSAIEGERYAIIFLGAYLLTRVKPDWLREDFQGRVLVGKSFATALIVAGLVLVGLGAGNANGGASASTLDHVPVITTVVPLHKRLGADQLDFGVESARGGVVGMADAGVANVGGSFFTKDLRPQALRNLDFERLGRVLHHAVHQCMPIQRRHGLEAADPRGEIAIRRGILGHAGDGRFREALLEHGSEFPFADLLLKDFQCRNIVALICEPKYLFPGHIGFFRRTLLRGGCGCRGLLRAACCGEATGAARDTRG
jgi:drug/metabolite transporter (DMT)-like permease